jgi:hypothetical protein
MVILRVSDGQPQASIKKHRKNVRKHRTQQTAGGQQVKEVGWTLVSIYVRMDDTLRHPDVSDDRLKKFVPTSVKEQRSSKNEVLSPTEPVGHSRTEELWNLFLRILNDGDKVAWQTMYSIACQNGEPLAQAIAGFCFTNRKIHFVRETRTAAEIFGDLCHCWLDNAVNRGCKYALFLKSVFIYRNVYYPQNLDAAIELCKMSADQGLPLALNFLGCHYEKQGSFSESRKYLEIAATAGCRLSQRSLGLLHLRTGDYIAAACWFQALADGGSPVALRDMANLHLKGRGVPKDIPRAVSYLLEARKRGNLEAARIVAVIMEEVDSDAYCSVGCDMLAY